MLYNPVNLKFIGTVYILFVLCWLFCVFWSGKIGGRFMDDLINWLYANGDYLMFLCRMLILLFALEFVTGLAWIIRGGMDSCK